MSVEILVGDCREKLREIDAASVHCCVTSPPYFCLRDYGHGDQIGLEPTPDEFVAAMVEVFREVRRVLRADGTLWLNLGDSYANKRRQMIPARVALALQADGWWLRDEIIWHKPNSMPASVTDRTTPAHEMIYLLSKSARYYYDAVAVKEPISVHSKPQKAPSRPPLGAEARLRNDEGRMGGGSRISEDGKRNRRSVWTVSTKPFKGAHFATFPPDLIKPCILAGCPIGGTVLDPFGGAGTTGLVAQAHGRNAILCELNPEYADMARDRIDEAVASPLAAKVIRAKRAKAPADNLNQVCLF